MKRTYLSIINGFILAPIARYCCGYTPNEWKWWAFVILGCIYATIYGSISQDDKN